MQGCLCLQSVRVAQWPPAPCPGGGHTGQAGCRGRSGPGVGPRRWEGWGQGRGGSHRPRRGRWGEFALESDCRLGARLAVALPGCYPRARKLGQAGEGRAGWTARAVPVPASSGQRPDALSQASRLSRGSGPPGGAGSGHAGPAASAQAEPSGSSLLPWLLASMLLSGFRGLVGPTFWELSSRTPSLGCVAGAGLTFVLGPHCCPAVRQPSSLSARSLWPLRGLGG